MWIPQTMFSKGVITKICYINIPTMRIQCIFHAILYAWTLELLKLSSVL